MAEKSHQDLLIFCAMCFATNENSSWGGEAMTGHCLNCGAGGSTIHIQRWAVDSIRQQASWVGRRYYPNPEDFENAAELKHLRALLKSFPGRSAQISKSQKEEDVWYVTQRIGKTKTVSQLVKAKSADEAIEATRYTLPYVPETEL